MMASNYTFKSGDLTGRRKFAGFTLVEVLVSMVILLMMLLIITQVIGTVQQTWRRASSRLSQFREARTAFDTINRGLRQATLNAYRVYDYGYGGPAGVPKAPLDAPVGYVRTAELGLVMGKTTPTIFDGLGGANLTPGHAVIFQAPMGYTAEPTYRPLNKLLCQRGYFVWFSSDADYMPQALVSRLQPKSRYRLYEYHPTTETNTVYTGVSTSAWTHVLGASAKADMRPVAENILTLILTPSFTPAASGTTGGATVAKLGKEVLAQDYAFNSYTGTPSNPGLKYRLPSTVGVVMVAIDEESASRLAQQYGTNPPQLFNAKLDTPASLSSDLRLIRDALLKLHVNYRIFSSTVIIPAADN